MEKCPHPRQGQQFMRVLHNIFGSAALVLSVCLRYLHTRKSFLPVMFGRMLLCFFPFLEQGSSNRKV